MHARPFIDSPDFARNGQQIGGAVPVSELSRLADLLGDTEGQFSYKVTGGVDKFSTPYLALEITGVVHLVCQRCMQGMDHEVAVSTLVQLRDQAELDRLDAEAIDEEFESILAEAQLDLWHLLEEEILLSLPFAPKHDVGRCQAASTAGKQQEEPHPFAALAKLKR